MSHRIKCLWNHRIKLYIDSGCLMQVLFYSIWHGSLSSFQDKIFNELEHVSPREHDHLLVVSKTKIFNELEHVSPREHDHL